MEAARTVWSCPLFGGHSTLGNVEGIEGPPAPRGVRGRAPLSLSIGWRHRRVGHILQGRFKAILVEKESHLRTLSVRGAQSSAGRDDGDGGRMEVPGLSEIIAATSREFGVAEGEFRRRRHTPARLTLAYRARHEGAFHK